MDQSVREMADFRSEKAALLKYHTRQRLDGSLSDASYFAEGICEQCCLLVQQKPSTKAL